MLGRLIGVAVGLLAMALGGFGLGASLAPEHALVDQTTQWLEVCVTSAVNLGIPVPIDSPEMLREMLAGPLLRFAVAPVGLILVLASLLLGRFGGGGSKSSEEGAGDSASDGSDPTQLSKLEKKFLKKTKKNASLLAKRGKPGEAADLLFSSGDIETAAEYFLKAKQYVRVAEIRHDQNRFLESAELYLKAGNFESAGTIFGQQEEWLKAAECYIKIERYSVAAEMFEKAEDHRKAAQCYHRTGFLRHAAQAYVKCKEWLLAAECLAEIYQDEGSKAQLDPKKSAELLKLVRQAGQLYRRAGEHDKAQELLERGGCAAEAAELALERNQYAKAAELFVDSGEQRKAAEALRSMGENEEAARILGLYHRDQGEVKEAADCFEEAGDYLAAGDLYRQLEDYERAGRCYREHNEFHQAAEMFKSAGDRAAAAECFERANRLEDAAECYALVGQPEKEAELLGKAGQFLRSGQGYHREGLDDEAIKVLQQVEPESEDFGAASALLGDIFQANGQLGLAIKQLRQAIGEAELNRENLDVYYTLAGALERNEDPSSAVDIYEKIMTFDYHHKDVEERLLHAREAVAALPPPAPTTSMASGPGQPSAASGQPGRYQIVGELGRGGMGIVYKANDTVLDRIVAYKVLPDGLNENPTALENFLREAKAAAKLNHPNIVTVYDCGEQDGRYYIAMEYVDGTTLKEIVRRRGGISPSGILHVLIQICEALNYAHEQKVVHRDIKTANAMWTRDKKAKIMDFGLARLLQEVRNHTTVVAGTPYYMSPEQTLGKNVDHRTDIYSLGVTVFEMATGSVPFKEGNIPYHHVHTPPPDVRELRSELPEELAKIINRCLMKDPAKRYQTAGEIIVDARAVLSQFSDS